MRCWLVMLLIALLVGCRPTPLSKADDEEQETTGDSSLAPYWGDDKENSHGIVAFSPEGQRAVVDSRDRGLALWDLGTGKQMRLAHPDLPPGVGRLGEHEGEGVRWAVFTPDGKQLLSAGDDHLLRLWDLKTGRELRRFVGHEGGVLAVAVSADGRLALSGSEDNTLKVWDMATGKELRTFTGHTDKIWSLALSPNGKTALSGSEDHSFRFWDVATGEQIGISEVYDGRVIAVAFSRDGKQALACTHGTVRLWDVARHKEVGPTLGDPRTAMHDAVFTPDGKFVLTGGDRGLKLWEVATAKVVLSCSTPPGHVKGVTVSPDGSRALSIQYRGPVTLWDLTSGEETRTLTGPPSPKPYVSAAAFSPDGKLIASAGEADTSKWQRLNEKANHDGRKLTLSHDNLTLWDVATGQVVRRLRGHQDRVACVVFTPDGKHLLSGSRDRTLKLWEVDSGRVVGTLVVPRTIEHPCPEVTALSLSADGKLALSASDGRILTLWDLGAGKEVRTFEDDKGAYAPVALFPDCKRMVSASADGTLRIWDVPTGECLRTIERPNAKQARPIPEQVALSGGGKLVLSTDAIIWETATGKVIRRLDEEQGNLTAVALSPDGKQVVTGGKDGSVNLWDIASGRLVRRFFGKGVPEQIWSVMFSPDGKYVLAAAGGGRIKLWDVTSDKEVRSFINPEDW